MSESSIVGCHLSSISLNEGSLSGADFLAHTLLPPAGTAQPNCFYGFAFLRTCAPYDPYLIRLTVHYATAS